MVKTSLRLVRPMSYLETFGTNVDQKYGSIVSLSRVPSWMDNSRLWSVRPIRTPLVGVAGVHQDLVTRSVTPRRQKRERVGVKERRREKHRVWSVNNLCGRPYRIQAIGVNPRTSNPSRQHGSFQVFLLVSRYPMCGTLIQ